jgi:hypothetical protein
MSFTGAGVLIVELYKSEPVITLFGLNNTNFSDLGGKLNLGENVEFGAYREAREESANLINIYPNKLLQYGISVIIGEYQCYVIYVKNLSMRDYIHNINHIFGTCNDDSWTETNIMTRINLFDIIKAANNGINNILDIYGNRCYIRERTMKVIRTGANKILSLITTPPILLQRNIVVHSKMPFLIGTYTYIGA